MFECKRVVSVLGDMVCRGLLLRCGCGSCCRGGDFDADFDPSWETLCLVACQWYVNAGAGGGWSFCFTCCKKEMVGVAAGL